MSTFYCDTQADLDAALVRATKADLIVCQGKGLFALTASGSAQVRASDSAQVRASGSAQVAAYGSAQVTAYDSAQVTAYGSAQVTAYGSAQVRASGSAQVTAYGSAQVTAYDSAQVRAYGSAQVRASDSAQVRASGSAQVRAYGSAQVTASDSAQVTAYDSAQVTAYGSAQVRASKYVAITLSSEFRGKATGGVQILLPPIRTMAEWCEFYGLDVKRGVVTLYKAVDHDWSTENARAAGIAYTPGTKPEAPDWDGAGITARECGGGLHFVPRPFEGLQFNSTATRYVACPVRLTDAVVHYPAQFPNKIKAKCVCAPIYEVDIDGNRLKSAKAVAK